VLVICGLWQSVPVHGQSGPEYPRTPWGGYSYSASYDAEIADPDVHRVLFENENIMFLEVSNPPELDVKMHGHPYPSVFARDTGGGQGTAGIPVEETHLDPTSPFAGKGWGQGPAPSGLQFPRCTTAPPEAPHKPINHGTVPVHFYRIEFRRLDAEDFRTHWRDWYPWMLNPGKPAPNPPSASLWTSRLSDEWPYPMAYDSVLAAPNDYRLLYEDGHVRLVEVTVRPGETTPAHGNPYASVLAFNTVTADEQEIVDTKLDAKSPLNDRKVGQGPAPSVFNMRVPTCTTVPPQAPHSIRNGSSIPLHYYRIEFKRVDGDAFQSHWHEWYPWMKYMKNMR
jgi:mannose-6-phosphate isomerase-like protein (cupin superfamily)